MTNLQRYLLPGVAALAGLGSTACQDPPQARELTSLRRSGDVTFVCVGPDGEGAPLSRCPQGGRAGDFGLTVGNDGHSLHALVTQTLSAEVAVVLVAGPADGGDSEGRVLDVDPTNPGVTPLRVGEKPTDIVTTPGGRASFVGVAQVGLEGIYGLPTECLTTPREGEPRRDRTSWPACSLSSAPGDMAVVVDGSSIGDTPREFCGAASSADLPRAGEDALCTADLSGEEVEPGARKLVVSLPDEGKLVVLDAQEILTRQPGTFQPCHVESELLLEADVPEEILQPLPNDLSEGSESTWVTYQGLSGPHTSRPAGMARDGNELLVADLSAPVIHRIDVSDVCAMEETPPLLATSFEEPTRVVTTSRVAVSPVSPTGAQFVYAVDQLGDGRPNVIVFDVSPGAASRAPLVRPGSPLLPVEAPDRIEFATGVKDVGFGLLDRSIVNPATGVASAGVLCDPDPDTPSDAAGALYRSSSDSSGAGPFVLRGLFGYALLSNGGIAVIDIEDFDAACRRPVQANPSSNLDFRGCAGDTIDEDFFTVGGDADSQATVTDEVSCRMVVPHRARSERRMRTTGTGSVSSPALRTFGRLNQDGRTLPLSRFTPEGKRNPIVLAVDFEAPDGSPVESEVYIGSALHRTSSLSDTLVIDPNEAERTSLALPMLEPRAYPPSEGVTIAYEGQLDRTHPTGAFSEREGDPSRFILTDPNVNFCALGLQDRVLTAEVAENHFGLADGAMERFVARHTDYLQITNRLFDEDDEYWELEGASCGDDAPTAAGQGFELCDSLFGERELDELSSARDLSLLRSETDALELTPRDSGNLSAEDHLKVLRCCLPGSVSYRARAGHQWVVRGTVTGFEHAVVVDPAGSGACVFDDSLRASRLAGRAFEVSSTICDNENPEDVESCSVGARTPDDVVCSYDATGGPVSVGGTASECIFDGLTRRFVVYRGLEPSERGMSFGYVVVGGFESQVISLVQSSSVVLPVSMVPVPSFGALGVVDSQNRGLMMIDLVNSHVAQSFF